MLNKQKVSVIAILISTILASAPMMFLVQGQIQVAPAEELVALAERAGQQVQNLIDMIQTNDEALLKIENVGLSDQFYANVTLYETEGLENLENAKQALLDSNYEIAVDFAIDALDIFREVYSSIHVILEAADLQKGHLIDNQGLLEAITRELQRIDRLKGILTADTPEEILDLLDDAEASLNEARALLLDGDKIGAENAFLEAKESIWEVYQYLKSQAEEFNIWRLQGYCERLRERIQERFRYGRDQGIDFTGVLQSLGYQSENQFMESLQNITQMAQGEESLENAVQYCEDAGQLVQEMEKALNQEINRHQAQYGQTGQTGSGYRYGGSGGGS